jgi:hypothetical protein
MTPEQLAADYLRTAELAIKNEAEVNYLRDKVRRLQSAPPLTARQKKVQAARPALVDKILDCDFDGRDAVFRRQLQKLRLAKHVSSDYVDKQTEKAGNEKIKLLMLKQSILLDMDKYDVLKRQMSSRIVVVGEVQQMLSMRVANDEVLLNKKLEIEQQQAQLKQEKARLQLQTMESSSKLLELNPTAPVSSLLFHQQKARTYACKGRIIITDDDEDMSEEDEISWRRTTRTTRPRTRNLSSSA